MAHGIQYKYPTAGAKSLTAGISLSVSSRLQFAKLKL